MSTFGGRSALNGMYFDDVGLVLTTAAWKTPFFSWWTTSNDGVPASKGNMCTSPTTLPCSCLQISSTVRDKWNVMWYIW